MTAFQFKHIANRLLFWILGACLLLFLTFSIILYSQASRALHKQAQARADLAVTNTIQQIEALLGSVGRSVLTARTTLTATTPKPEELVQLLQQLLVEKPGVYGMALALEPETLSTTALFAPYVYRDGNSLRASSLATPDYDYLNQPWYRRAVDRKQAMWSEPYYDDGGGDIPMVTYSAPIADADTPDAPVLGVLTADITLQSLDNIVSQVQLGSRGYGYILSGDGRIITHSKPALRMQPVQNLPAWRAVASGWRKVLTHMQEGGLGQGLLPCATDSHDNCWFSYRPLQGSDWSIVVVIPQADVDSELYTFARYMLGAGTAAILLLALVVLWLSRRLTRPLHTLATATARVAQGELQVAVDDFGLQDEIGQLARHFGDMQRDLGEHIQRLTIETAQRQRMESEMDIAASIQGQMLPDGGYSKVAGRRFELTAVTRPARRIGGDFYLYDDTNPGQLFFLVGDVSDKGVPAALFMARAIAEARTLLSRASILTQGVGQLLESLNRELCRDNENCMFVTAIAATLETETGMCRLVSAGHSAPLMCGGTIRALPLESGPAMGLMETVEYPEFCWVLEPGKTLLLFTDGADEAMDENQRQFGVEGIMQIIREHPAVKTDQLIENLLLTLKQYQNYALFDDITLMAITRV